MEIGAVQSLQNVFNSTKFILLYATSVALFLSALKIIFFQFSWQIINANLISYFASILAGIIFLLGIILAGVFSDYKESEKMPSDLANSLSSIWQNACIQKENLVKDNQNNACIFLQKKLHTFVCKFKADFLTGKPDAIKDLVNIVDSFSDDVLRMDNQGMAPIFTTRIMDEQANLRRQLFRIEAIKGSFTPSLFKMVEVIIVLFTICMLLLNVEPITNGVILIFFYAFLLTSIILILEDLDNPFAYRPRWKILTDEIDFKTLFDRLEKSFAAD